MGIAIPSSRASRESPKDVQTVEVADSVHPSRPFVVPNSRACRGVSTPQLMAVYKH